MNYVNYDKSIVQSHHVKIVGWPESVPFITPSNMTRCDDARNLLHALRSNTCHWVRLSRTEVNEHMDSICQREAAGETVGRKRKERADKGKKRKRRCHDNWEDSEDISDGDGTGSDASQARRSKRKGEQRDTRSSRRKFRSKTIIYGSDEAEE
jgi:hypothetical protein